MSGVLTRRARRQDDRVFNLSNPALFQAISQVNPALGRNLAVSLANREIYNSMMENTFRRGHHLYGEERFQEYLEDLPTEERLLNDALQIIRDPNTQEIIPNPNFTSNNNAALRFCVRHNYEECVRRLLRDPRVDVNAGWGTRTVLSVAVENGNINMARALIARGAQVDLNLNARDDESLLFWALNSENVDMIQYIISLGLNTVQILDYFKINRRRSYEITDFVMKYYMNTYFDTSRRQDRKVYSALSYIVDNSTRTPIRITSEQLIQIFTFVFDAGLDITGIIEHDGFSIFNYACYLDDTYIPFVQFLISRGFRVRLENLRSATGFNRWLGLQPRTGPEMLRFLLTQIQGEIPQ